MNDTGRADEASSGPLTCTEVRRLLDVAKNLGFPVTAGLIAAASLDRDLWRLTWGRVDALYTYTRRRTLPIPHGFAAHIAEIGLREVTQSQAARD
ncbi:hypothetical protein [Nocardia sp. NPDC047038]|uniref:hypothetical protein n=1 Tax=Nocardia sp. NPDC047038 TaxID=3154338 RepID=UPI0033F92F6E